jgi:hypothetical protein
MVEGMRMKSLCAINIAGGEGKEWVGAGIDNWKDLT